MITGGYKVYPRHVEEAVYAHPAVEECVCAGVPDTYRGENVKVWIKLKPNYRLSEKELHEFLKERLSPIAMPRLIEFRDKPLPKTMIGKLSRKDLKAES
jgi:long-chain acyl-CoA synthetase